MLTHLEVRNIALIEHLNLEFGKGLNILTGETGAGKSILIDSINAVLGSRVSRELIRTGSDRAGVQAAFQVGTDIIPVLENYGIDYDEGTLILSRQISDNGKNICRINGTMVTVAILKEIGQNLIDIHGQYDNQSLLRTETHIEMLDMFAGKDLYCVKGIYLDKLSRYNSIKEKLGLLMGNDKDRERRMDLLRYQVQEIQRASLRPGEEEELEQQSRIQANIEKILGAFGIAYEYLNNDNTTGGCAIEYINRAISEIENISGLNTEFEDIAVSLNEAVCNLEDISSQIRRDRDKIEYNPELQAEVEQRLDLISELKRKYGETIEDMLAYAENAEKQLEELENSRELVESYRGALKDLDDQLYNLAIRMHDIRARASLVMEKNICLELEELEMKKARFKVRIDMNQGRKYTGEGLDSVEFLISPNAGEELKALAKIASGGEMSRIMLAIKTILAEIDKVPTLIFDEIDTGVSGKAALRVGEKLFRISGGHQVICITHLAQIASLADSHYMIEKNIKGNKTLTSVQTLGKQERTKELARLLSGESVTAATISLAEEMLLSGEKLKNGR